MGAGGGSGRRAARWRRRRWPIGSRRRAIERRCSASGIWVRPNVFIRMARGFDEFYGFLGGEHSYFEAGAQRRESAARRHGVRSRRPEYLTDVLTDRAVDFIKREKSRPFFLYLAFNAVHTPMHAPDKYLSRVQGHRGRAATHLRGDVVGDGRRRSDGRSTTLRAEGLEENTLVFFFSDNGGPDDAGHDDQRIEQRAAARVEAADLEGGIRVPFIMRWKGQLPEGKIDARPIIQLDILPTALAAAGVDREPEWKLDGVNLLPYLTGQGPAASARGAVLATVRAHGDPQRRLEAREDDGGTAVGQRHDPAGSSGAQLFNLADDIGEQKDLAAARPEKVKELTGDWLRWNKELAAPGWGPGAGGRGRGNAPTLEGQPSTGHRALGSGRILMLLHLMINGCDVVMPEPALAGRFTSRSLSPWICRPMNPRACVL